MAKKRKPHKAAKASVAKHQSDSKGPNPFEQFHAKRRFDILGATPKASKKKTGAVQLTKARAAAVNKVWVGGCTVATVWTSGVVGSSARGWWYDVCMVSSLMRCTIHPLNHSVKQHCW